MSAQILTILLWLPLAAVVLGIGSHLFLRGWRRDLFPPLMSLAATVVSLPLALVITNLLRPAIAPPLAWLLCRSAGDTDSLTSVLSHTVTAIFVESLVGVCLFSALFGLLAFGLKSLATRLFQKKLPAGYAPWGSVAATLNALLLSFFLLLPLYGTAAAYGPSLHTFFGMPQAHPAAAPWAAAPARALYDDLARVDTDSGPLLLTDTLPTLEALSQQAALSDANNPRSLTEEHALLDFLRQEVVRQEWFRPLYAQFRENTRVALAKNAQMDYLTRELMLLVLDAPPRQLQKDCLALLDSGCAVLESGTTKTVMELALTVLDMSGWSPKPGSIFSPQSELTLTERAQKLLYGDLAQNTVKSLVILLGDDPLDIGDGLSVSQKQWLSRVVTNLGEGAMEDPGQRDNAVKYLKRFFGL